LEIRGGTAGAVRLKLAIEEHGAGKQMLLFRLQPRITAAAIAALIVLVLFSTAAIIDHSIPVGATFAAFVFLAFLRIVSDCTAAGVAAHNAIESLSRKAMPTGEAVAPVVYLGWL
jgi:hypothetical protein